MTAQTLKDIGGGAIRLLVLGSAAWENPWYLLGWALLVILT